MTTLLTFVGFLFIIGGTVWLVLFGIPIWLGISSRRWPTTEGEILESSVVHDEDAFRPKVKYRYRIGDVEYLVPMVIPVALITVGILTLLGVLQFE